MIAEPWLRELVRKSLAEVDEAHRRRREFPGFSQRQIEAGLAVPVLVTPSFERLARAG